MSAGISLKFNYMEARWRSFTNFHSFSVTKSDPLLPSFTLIFQKIVRCKLLTLYHTKDKEHKLQKIRSTYILSSVYFFLLKHHQHQFLVPVIRHRWAQKNYIHSSFVQSIDPFSYSFPIFLWHLVKSTTTQKRSRLQHYTLSELTRRSATGNSQ